MSHKVMDNVQYHHKVNALCAALESLLIDKYLNLFLILSRTPF